MGGGAEGRLGREEEAFGREGQAKVSMGARHAPLPLPGPSLAPHGLGLDLFPYLVISRLISAPGQRIHSSERNVALHIPGATSGRRTARVWHLAVARCTQHVSQCTGTVLLYALLSERVQ